MPGLADRERLARFMRALGEAAQLETRVYLTGGASAVLFDWRKTTIDVDLTFEPESDEIFRAIATLKDQLQVNVELASPAHFIPAVPGWQSRSIFIRREGKASFYHYDFYAQALAKIERGHAQDLNDVACMVEAGLVDRKQLPEFFDRLAGDLPRYPAISVDKFRSAVKAAAALS